jgi:PAS domain S-box-containing protein
MDINNFIIELNRKAAGLLGGTQKELINARFSSFIKKEHQMVFHEIKKLARTELSAKTFEIEIQRENDRPFWVNITLEPLRHKSKASAGSFMTLTDISELKKKRRVSSEVNARIERISDFLPFLICLTNSRGECIYFNNSWLDFTGKTFEHEYGKGWMNQIHRKDIGAFMNYFRNMLKKQSMMEGVLRLKHHTGSYRETLFRFIPEFSFDNTFKGYIGCFTPAMERSGKAPPMFKGVA